MTSGLTERASITNTVTAVLNQIHTFGVAHGDIQLPNVLQGPAGQLTIAGFDQATILPTAVRQSLSAIRLTNGDGLWRKKTSRQRRLDLGGTTPSQDYGRHIQRKEPLYPQCWQVNQAPMMRGNIAGIRSTTILKS